MSKKYSRIKNRVLKLVADRVINFNRELKSNKFASCYFRKHKQLFKIIADNFLSTDVYKKLFNSSFLTS